MPLTATAARTLALLGVVLGSGCAHRRASDRAFEEDRERTVTLASDVTVRATLWDRELVERTVAATDVPKRRSALADRLRARYDEGVVFTVLLELGHRAPQDDPLADPSTWWFALADGSRTIEARDVDVLAVDRFPTGGDRVHLRIALRVAFPSTDDDASVVLRVGNRAHEQRRAGGRAAPRTSRRLALGPVLARRGAALRWEPSGPRP